MGWSLGLVARLAVSWVCCCLAAGPLQSFGILSSLYVRDGLFAESCGTSPLGECAGQTATLQSLLYVSLCVSVVLLFVVGLFFDSFGGKASGVVGGLLVCLGMLLHSLAVSRAPGLLFVALPLADVGGYLSSISMMCFLWHAGPQHRGLILGFVHSNYQISTLGSNLLEWLVVDKGVSLRIAILFFAAAGLVSAALTGLVNAGLDEYRSYVALAIEGDVPPPAPFAPWTLAKAVVKTLGKHRFLNVVFFVYITVCYTFSLNVVGSYFEWEVVQLGLVAGNSLVVWGSIITAVTGLIMSPLSGAIFDSVGLLKFSVFIGILLIASCISLWPATYAGGLVVSLLLNTYFSCFLTLLGRWATIFGPSEMVGSLYGFLLGAAGILQLGINYAFSLAMSRLFVGRLVFLIPFASLGILSIIVSAALVIALLNKPQPTTIN